MTVAQFIPAVLLAATRKTVVFSSVTETKSAIIIAIANQLIDDWANEPNVDWTSLYAPDTSIGTVTTATSYAIPVTVRKISGQEGDVVRILHADNTTFTDYAIIDSDRQKDYANLQRTFQDNYITLVGETLRFNRAFAATDAQFGGTIYIPAYLYPIALGSTNTPPNYLVVSTDVIPVDIPNWLVYATAAQYNSSDVTRQQLVPRLETKANELLDTMKANNGPQVTMMYRPWRPGVPSAMGEVGLP